MVGCVGLDGEKIMAALIDDDRRRMTAPAGAPNMAGGAVSSSFELKSWKLSGGVVT